MVKEEVSPLIYPDDDEIKALRFDALIFGIELAYLSGKKYSRGRTDLIKKAAGLAKVANIPAVGQKGELIDRILHSDYLDNAGINEFEHIRDGELIALECTAMNAGRSISFDDAKNLANELIKELADRQIPDHEAIDVQLAREIGVRPIPVRKHSKAPDSGYTPAAS